MPARGPPRVVPGRTREQTDGTGAAADRGGGAMSSAPAPEWPGRADALAFAGILLKEPGSVAELRALNVRRGQYSTNASGYFDDPEKFVAAAASLDGVAQGVYVTLN